MTNWQVLQFSGYGRFDHEADTREAALVLVLPRPEEGIARSIFPEGALFRKSVFRRGQRYQCPAELVPWPRVLSVSEDDLQILHGANVPASYLEVCCLLSFVFLTAWKRCPLTAASQPGRGETSFV